MNSHTPGPWAVSRNLPASIGPLSRAIPIEMNSRGVIEVMQPLESISDGEAKANARLIAAAPDLLATLLAAPANAHQGYCRKWQTSQTVDCSCAMKEWLEAVDAAIAKARGEAVRS